MRMGKGFKYLSVIFIFTGLIASGCGIKEEWRDSFEKAESIMASVEEDSEEDSKSEESIGKTPEELKKELKKALEKGVEKKQVFQVIPYDMRFTFSDDWEETTDHSQFDLQMKRGNRYYCSIFGFKDIDLANDMTPEDIYELQKEDLLGKRDFTELVREEPVWEDESRKIYRELYSGELDGIKYYYYCCLVDFKEPAQGLAWVVFSGVPSWVENDVEELDQILMSAEDVGDPVDVTSADEDEG